MATKAKAAKVETIEDKAQRLIDVRLQQKQLKEKEGELEMELRLYVKETGAKDVGNLLAYERTSAAKLIGLENKALKVAEEQLMNALDPTYVKRSLDVGKMFAALHTDKIVVGLLSERGLKIEQGSEIYFKAK
jgi:aldehyde:ferredoxin oxidoreductase